MPLKNSSKRSPVKAAQDKIAQDTEIKSSSRTAGIILINDIKVTNFHSAPTSNCQLSSINVVNPELLFALIIQNRDKAKELFKALFQYARERKYQTILTVRDKYFPEEFINEVISINSNYDLRYKTISYSNKQKFAHYFITFYNNQCGTVKLTSKK